MSAAFATLRLARTLRDKAQFSTEQAEGMADAIAEVMQGDLATKRDVADVRTDVREAEARLQVKVEAVRTDLPETELRFEAKIEPTKAELIKWVVGMIGFQTIVLLGAALALARAVAK